MVSGVYGHSGMTAQYHVVVVYQNVTVFVRLVHMVEKIVEGKNLKHYPVTTKAVQVCLSTSFKEGGEKSQALSCNNQSCCNNQTWTALVVTGQCLRFLPSLFL
jgi:hypothetical protein